MAMLTCHSDFFIIEAGVTMQGIIRHILRTTLPVLLAAIVVQVESAAQTTSWSRIPSFNAGDITEILADSQGRIIVVAGWATMRSIDRGATWDSIGTGSYLEDYAVGPDAFYRLRRDTLAKSTDGGATWSTIGRGLFQESGLNVWDMRVIDSKTLVVADYQNGIAVSTDEGVTWNWADRGVGSARIIGHLDQRVFVGGVDLLRSRDGGKTFMTTKNRPWGISSLAVLPDNVVIAGSGDGVWLSTDDGDTWTMSTIQTRVTTQDIRDLVKAPDGRVYGASNWYNALVSSDGGQVWTSVTSQELSFESLAISGDRMFAGSGDALYVLPLSTSGVAAEARPVLSSATHDGDAVTVRYHSASPAPVTLSVYDLTGRCLVRRIVDDARVGENQVHLGDVTLMSGYYRCEIRTGGSAAASVPLVVVR
jgi:hypothetical protein